MMKNSSRTQQIIPKTQQINGTGGEDVKEAHNSMINEHLAVHHITSTMEMFALIMN